MKNTNLQLKTISIYVINKFIFVNIKKGKSQIYK